MHHHHYQSTERYQRSYLAVKKISPVLTHSARQLSPSHQMPLRRAMRKLLVCGIFAKSELPP